MIPLFWVLRRSAGFSRIPSVKCVCFLFVLEIGSGRIIDTEQQSYIKRNKEEYARCRRVEARSK